MVALRDSLHQLEMGRVTPADHPNNAPYVVRAIRARDGIDPMPACISPDPETGEYTTVEARYRAYWEEESDARSVIDIKWRTRSRFVHALERLEQLRLMIGPPHVGLRSLENDDHLTQLYIEYGTLLETDAQRYICGCQHKRCNQPVEL